MDGQPGRFEFEYNTNGAPRPYPIQTTRSLLCLTSRILLLFCASIGGLYLSEHVPKHLPWIKSFVATAAQFAVIAVIIVNPAWERLFGYDDLRFETNAGC